MEIAVTEIEKALGVKICMSAGMQSAIALWSEMYIDDPPWRYGDNRCTNTLNLPAVVATEFARLTTLEMDTRITGSARAAYLDGQYQPVIPLLRKHVEYGCAKGSMLMKPYPDNGRIAVDFVHADDYWPTAFDSTGRLLGAVIPDYIIRERKRYTRLEYHRMGRDANGSSICLISNSAYVSHADIGSGLGRPIPLNSVPEWADLSPEVQVDSGKLLLGCFSVPLANTIDPKSPLGVSVYARAVDQIQEADRQYSRILWEYEGSELAIDADPEALKISKSKHRLPHREERLFRALSLEKEDLYQVFAPSIRDASLFHGLEEMYRNIEKQCSLAYGTLSDPQQVEKSATEVKASKQRSYAAVADIQKALQKALGDVVDAMDVWATYMDYAPTGGYDVSYNWDDSLVIDADTERLKDKEDVRDGIMQKWEYRAKWYGEDEATAKKMVAQEVSDNELMGFID